MKYNVTQYSICVPLTNKQWEKLMKKENDYWHNGKPDLITPPLKKVGADRIDFNGHFGRNIFFNVESLDIMPEVMKCLKGIVGS
jgi:hypothetical protein